MSGRGVLVFLVGLWCCFGCRSGGCDGGCIWMIGGRDGVVKWRVRFSVLGIPIRQPELSRIGDRFPDSQSSDQIEDPFEQPVNSARGVSSKQLARISETFKTTCNKLSSPNQDLSLHISTLVRPRV
nr:protein HESO1-like [Ipomoea trifida]